MHFAVPEVHELQESNGTNYQAFHLHVNGAMHCIVRYSQLHNMNEQLKLEFQQNVPQFPPKKIFTLKGNELEERRKQLEVYMQELSQNEELLSSQIFTSFLQKAQQETRLETTTQVELDIYLMNHNKVTLTCNSTDQSEDVLENLMLLIGLEEDLVYYFGLFLVEDYNVDDDRLVLVRQLQNFECPYITLKSLEGKSNYKIVVRKTYWDTSFDAMLLHNSVALNLLHTQAQKDIKMGWMECPKQTRKQLAQYTRKHSKREYMQLAQSLHKYNYLQFQPCECSYPVVGSRVVVSVGGYELRLMYLGKNEEKTTEEATFQVTRIKSWKIACRHKLKSPSRHTNNNNNAELQLSFEYLIDKENLKWIHIQSNQAIVISMSIKSMVNEIVMKKNGNKIKKPSDRPNRKHYEYKPRDESASSHLFNSHQNHQEDQKEEKINLKKRITNKMRRLSWRRSVNLPSDQEGGDYSRLLGNDYGDMGDTGIGEDNL